MSGPNLLAPLDPTMGADETLVRCGKLTLSRAEVWRLVAAEAQRLVRSGVHPGDRVAIATENCHVALTGFLAALATGAIAVPVNVRLAQSELAAILEEAHPVAVLCHSAQEPLIRSLELRTASDPVVLTAEWEPPLQGRDWTPVGHGDVIAIFFTGGSTGRPKGVQITASNFAANARHFATIVDAQPGLRYLHLAPMFHLADAGVSMLVHVSRGQHVFLGRFDARLATEALAAGIADWTDVVPTMLQRMLEQPSMRGAERNLRTIIYGGASMPPAAVRKAIDRFGPVLIQTYGLSEATSLVSALTASQHVEALSDPAWSNRLSSCGCPVEGVEVTLDSDSHEILVRGSNVMSGYWRQPEETARALQGGWLHTGDVGRFDGDGFLHLSGRLRDAIITGGETVYAGEVERVVRAVPGVIEVAVIGLPDERWGEAVHAVVYAEKAFRQDVAQAVLDRELARFKHPKGWTLVEHELPKTPIGKVAKAVLREHVVAGNGAPDASAVRLPDVMQAT